MAESLSKDYSVFMVDPPWPYGKETGKRTVNGIGYQNYELMTETDIFWLLDKDIFSHATANHVVFMWAIERSLAIAERYMAVRRYVLHARLIWDKGDGFCPARTIRYQHEYLLWFWSGSFMRVAKGFRGKLGSIFKEPAREPSRKPDYAYWMVRVFYPNENRLDVFSRETREGWDQWGKETDFFA